MKIASVLTLCAAAAFAAGCQHTSTPPTPPATPAPVAAVETPAAPAATPAKPAVAPAPENATSYLFGWGDVPTKIANPRGGSSRGAPVTLAPDRALPLAEVANARDAFAKDRAAILALAGDYKVTFHFMETVGLTEKYSPKAPYHSWATEQVRVLADTGKLISLQHTLVMFMKKDDGTISEPMVMKHWRQDWIYEDTDLHTFRGQNTWARKTLTADEARGTWSQAVFQVDDSPRYEAFGPWTHNGNVSQWTGSREFRPLPRREHTTRKDYDVMEGVHRIVLTPTGWLHEQQNWKRVSGDTSVAPTYVAQELGLDRYDRITAPSLAAADKYFEKSGAYWTLVRKVWAEEFTRRDRFVFLARKNGQSSFEAPFAYAEKLEKGEPFNAVEAEQHARASIEAFIEQK
ncbi:DUF6607 family protein [Oleiharenicola lentus]|uniref:DUF6607 family protein n=1 Tax=Oleiharenicola lentus TaxID=2508720 RepID=UPI003F67905D